MSIYSIDLHNIAMQYICKYLYDNYILLLQYCFIVNMTDMVL
jgi:hypothetical protein